MYPVDRRLGGSQSWSGHSSGEEEIVFTSERIEHQSSYP